MERMNMKKIQKIQKNKLTLKGVPNGVVYHYTTYESFRKIIKSGHFLMTHYKDFEDKDELVWALDYYSNLVSNLFVPKLALEELRPHSFYVFSTCLRENNAYLWEEYASSQNNNYDGVVIGINVTNLYEHFSVKRNLINLSAVDYDRNAFMAICQESITGLSPIALAAPINLPKPINFDNPQEALQHFPGYKEYEAKRKLPLGMATLQKQPEYAKEEEVRLIHWPHEIHNLLCIRKIKNSEKAALPWIIENNHLITEVIISDKNVWMVKNIRRVLSSANIYAKVRIIENKLFI